MKALQAINKKKSSGIRYGSVIRYDSVRSSGKSNVIVYGGINSKSRSSSAAFVETVVFMAKVVLLPASVLVWQEKQ